MLNEDWDRTFCIIHFNTPIQMVCIWRTAYVLVFSDKHSNSIIHKYPKGKILFALNLVEYANSIHNHIRGRVHQSTV